MGKNNCVRLSKKGEDDIIIDPNKNYIIIEVEKWKRELEMKRNVSHFKLVESKTLFKNKQLTNYSYYTFFYYVQGQKDLIDELLDLLKEKKLTNVPGLKNFNLSKCLTED